MWKGYGRAEKKTNERIGNVKPVLHWDIKRFMAWRQMKTYNSQQRVVLHHHYCAIKALHNDPGSSSKVQGNNDEHCTWKIMRIFTKRTVPYLHENYVRRGFPKSVPPCIITRKPLWNKSDDGWRYTGKMSSSKRRVVEIHTRNDWGRESMTNTSAVYL